MMRASRFSGYSDGMLTAVIWNHRCELSSQAKHREVLETGSVRMPVFDGIQTAFENLQGLNMAEHQQRIVYSLRAAQL
jgi:hypothetical protein